MSFEKEKKDDVVIFRIEKERFDTAIAPEFKTELLLTITEGAKKVLIDLSNVKYADSSGLGSLLFGLRQIRDHKGTLKIFKANSRIINLIRIAKLESVLLNYETEQEALNSF